MSQAETNTTTYPGTGEPISVDDAINQFVELTRRKRQLAAEQRDIQQSLDDLSRRIIGDFTDRGRQSVKQNGATVYLQRDISVKSKTGNTADVVDKLRRARLGELIGLNWPRVKSWVKERMHDDTTDTFELDPQKLPPSLREVVEVDEFYRLNCRNS